MKADLAQTQGELSRVQRELVQSQERCVMLESAIEEIRKNADLRSQQFRTQELKYMQEVDELHT